MNLICLLFRYKTDLWKLSRIFRIQNELLLTFEAENLILWFIPSLFWNKCMQIIPQKISTVHASMPIENTKVSRLFPVCNMLRFCKIENDCNSIFVILTNRTLIGGCRVGPYGTMCIFWMLSRLKIWYGKEIFGERRMLVFISFDTSLLKIEIFRLNKNFFSNNFIYLFDWRFRFWSWLILDNILNCWCFAYFNALVGVVEILLLIILFWVEVRSTLLDMLCSCWFC